MPRRRLQEIQRSGAGRPRRTRHCLAAAATRASTSSAAIRKANLAVSSASATHPAERSGRLNSGVSLEASSTGSWTEGSTSNLGVPDTVMRLTANVEPGNSGGPVLDGRERVVRIVYAIE